MKTPPPPAAPVFRTDPSPGVLAELAVRAVPNSRAQNRIFPCASLLTQLDPHAFAASLTHWLQAQHGTLPHARAVDGQYVRDQVLTLCLSEPETGAPVAMAIADPAPRTDDAKKAGELTATRRRYPQTERNGALVTAAARHCEPETRRHLVERGGDFLVQLQANQPTALATASPLLPATRPIAATAGLTPAGSKSSRWNRWQ